MRSSVLRCLAAATGLVLPGASSIVRAAELKRIPKPTTFEPAPAVQPRSPEEMLKVTEIAKGYRLELVLSEPDIKEPVAMGFDGDGRIFVAEMRTYMQDVNGTGEHDRKSRVSLHWS